MKVDMDDGSRDELESDTLQLFDEWRIATNSFF